MSDLAALRDALVGNDLRRALASGLAIWRRVRLPPLANLIDRLGTQIAAPHQHKPRPPALQTWWCERARPYNPETVSLVVGRAHDRLKLADEDWRSVVARYGTAQTAGGTFIASFATICANVFAVAHTNALVRLATVIDWPLDPRVCAVATQWLVDGQLRWDGLELPGATELYYQTLAALLADLADPRARPALEECLARPRGVTQQVQRLQVEAARAVMSAIQARERSDKSAQYRVLGVPEDRIGERRGVLELLGARTSPETEPTATQTDDELWAACARERDAVAPRLVLADALLQRGDPRGEAIVLSCQTAAPRGDVRPN